MRTGAFKIAALYTVAGILWITLSDRLLLAMQNQFDLQVVVLASSLKGIGYVLFTGIMLYKLIQLYTRRLANSEEQYRSYFEEHPTPHWIVNRRTMLFVAVNHSAIKHYDYSKEALLKMSALDFTPGEDINEWIILFRQLKAGLNNIGIRRQLKRDGTFVNISLMVQVLAEGHTENVMVSILSPEQRKENEN